MSESSDHSDSDSSYRESSDESQALSDKVQNIEKQKSTARPKRERLDIEPKIRRDHKHYATLKEVHSCLDHVIAYGNQIWQDAKQYDDWMKRKDKNPQPLGHRAAEVDWLSHIREEAIRPKVAVHIEDAVLYSNLQNVRYKDIYDADTLKRSRRNKTPAVLFEWPINYDDIIDKRMEHSDEKVSSNKNHEWECYFGDGLDENDFIRHRSQKRKFTHVASSSSGNQYEGTLELDSLIQRSWDKAVHAASNIFEVEISCKNQDKSSGDTVPNQDNLSEKQAKSEGEHENEVSDRLIQAQSVLRCKQLNIEFDPIYIPDLDPYYTCQICKEKMRFDGNEQVIIHLFGSVTERGCCWNRIREEEEKITQKLLQNEALNIIDNLLQIIFKKLKQRKDEKIVTSPMNWLDVCNAMMETLEKAKNVKQMDIEENNLAIKLIRPQSLSHDDCVATALDHSYGAVMEEEDESKTIQIDHDHLPFLLNKNIMKIVLSRLIGRYNDRCTKY